MDENKELQSHLFGDPGALRAIDPIEAMIQAAGKTAPRVTPDLIEATIAGVEYHRLSGTLLVCVLTLRNGYTVTGESACASPENFDETIGRRISRESAVRKIWPLEGYLLRQRLHDAPADDQDAKVERIAYMAHMVNRGYCAALGDTSQAHWSEAPDWQKESARNGVRMHLRVPDATPERSHENWLAEKKADGWKWGAVKDVEKKEHPCFLPYEQLPSEQRAKDYLFKAVVDALR